MQDKEPYLNSKWLLVGFPPPTWNVECTPSVKMLWKKVLFIIPYMYVS